MQTDKQYILITEKTEKDSKLPMIGDLMVLLSKEGEYYSMTYPKYPAHFLIPKEDCTPISLVVGKDKFLYASSDKLAEYGEYYFCDWDGYSEYFRNIDGRLNSSKKLIIGSNNTELISEGILEIRNAQDIIKELGGEEEIPNEVKSADWRRDNLGKNASPDQPIPNDTAKGEEEKTQHKIKSANEWLWEYSIDTGKMDDDFNTNLFMAMERYAEQYASKVSSSHLPAASSSVGRESDKAWDIMADDIRQLLDRILRDTGNSSQITNNAIAQVLEDLKGKYFIISAPSSSDVSIQEEQAAEEHLWKIWNNGYEYANDRSTRKESPYETFKNYIQSLNDKK